MDNSFVFMLVVWITYKKLLIYRITAASKKLLISTTAAIFTRSWKTNCFVEMFELSGKHHQNSSFCFCTLFIFIVVSDPYCLCHTSLMHNIQYLYIKNSVN